MPLRGLSEHNQQLFMFSPTDVTEQEGVGIRPGVFAQAADPL